MFSLCPSNPDFLDTLNFLLKLIGGAGAFYLFIVGIKRYSVSQAWKRNEFVANEIKLFNEDKMVINTKFMLDWAGGRLIELFPNEPEFDARFFKVDSAILKQALRSPMGPIKFSKAEVAIRDNFDKFLDHLEKFDQFIEAGLITKNELHPYLKYWINKMSSDPESEFKKALYNYIKIYEFDGVPKLFERFGKNVSPRDVNEAH
jgi:hypothetical protein